ncbi:hypothetical protein D3C81_1770100 [compost metagenome]
MQETLETDVLQAGGLEIHAHGDIQQIGDAAAAAHVARGGFVHACQGLEQCGLARAVVADQAQFVALPQFEGNILERVHDGHVAAGRRHAATGDRRHDCALHRAVVGAVNRQLHTAVDDTDVGHIKPRRRSCGGYAPTGEWRSGRPSR